MDWDILTEPETPFVNAFGEWEDLKTNKRRLVLSLPDEAFLGAWRSVLLKRKEEGEAYETAMTDLCLLTWDILFVGEAEHAASNRASMDAVYREQRREPVHWEKAPDAVRVRFLKKSQRVSNKINVLNRRFKKESGGEFGGFPIPKDTKRKRRRQENEIGLAAAKSLMEGVGKVEF